MNCPSCQKESDAYFNGKLPGEIRIQVEKHLEVCPDCAEHYRLLSLANLVIREEKELESNPFLVTRVMAGIEALDQLPGSVSRIPVYHQLLRSALIGTSVAAAIFLGVIVGSIYNPSLPGKQLPVELAYLNDAALESVDLLSLD